MFADYHVHSDFSWDSRTPMETQIQAALRAGVEELCFTEHVDYGARSGEDNCDYSAYRRELGFRELCAFHQMEPEFYPL